MAVDRTLATTVPRPRVEERLLGGLARGPVAVLAPGGYGKTAAVGAALARWDGPVVWHACGEADGDAGRLLVSVLRALREVVPGAADALLAQLAEPGAAVDPPAVLGALLAELRTLLLEPLVLVLDDGEHLPSDAPTLALLDGLLDADPGTFRLVLAARRRPALRLSRRVAAGTLELLEEADLRFDADECAQLLAARGREPTDAAVAAVLEETRGWPLGIALGVSGRDERERRLDHYLAEEVLDALDPVRRAALLDTTVDEGLDPDGPVLPTAPPDLLDVAARLGIAPQRVAGAAGGAGPSGAAARLAWHPLVREALAARWRDERPAAARAELTAAVARRALDAGRPADAVDGFLAAGRPQEAAAAMALAAPGVLRAAPATVARWLDALPPELRERDPDAAWLGARLASAEGRIRDAARRYAAALPALDPDRRDAALMGIAESAYFLGDLAVAEPVRALLERPEAHGDRPVALLASAWLGIVLVAHGEVDRGVALAERAFAQPAGDFARSFELLLRTIADAPGGGHDAIRERLVALDAGELEFPEWMASIRGFLATDVGRSEEAVRQAERMASRAERPDGTRYWQSLGAVQHAWSLAVAGKVAEAEVALAPLRDGAFEGWPSCWVDAGLALVAAARGDREETRERAARALESNASAPLFLRYLLACDLARALATVGDHERALTLVDDRLGLLRDRLGERRAAHGIARLRAVRAWLLRHAAEEAVGVSKRSARDADDEPAGVLPPADATADLRAALAAGPDVVRVEWRCLHKPVWEALERRALDAEATVAVVGAAFEGGPEALELAAHPTAAVRAATAPIVAASDHPAAQTRLRALIEDADAAVAARAADAEAHRRRRGAGPARAFRLFGGFELRRGAWPIEERAWSRPTAARLVRFLLAHDRGPVPQEVIVEALWPERPAGAAKTQLQVAVSRARQVLDPPDAEPSAGSAITFSDGAYRLVLASGDRVDTEQFERAAAAALERADDGRRAALAEAAALWTGPPLPEERYAGWADDWRERLEATHHRVLAALARAHRDAGDEAGVADAARRLVTFDELDEGAHRLLIEAYARTGRPALALRQYLACRRALVEGLGLEPSAETSRLQTAVLAGEAI